jgi:hypothetical protein
MRIIPFFLLILLLGISPAQAQRRAIEINGSYGFISAPRVANYASNALGTIGTLGSYDVYNHKNAGPISVHAKYGLSDRIKLGLNLNYEQQKEKTKENELNIGEINMNYYSLMPSFTYNYWQWDKCQIYGCVSLGIGIENSVFLPVDKESETENSFRFAYQVSALGIKYGKKAGFFMEIGYGYNGIFQAGVFYTIQ